MKKSNVFSLLAIASISTSTWAQTSSADYPWMDKSKSFRERAELLCKELTLREKVD